MPVCLDAANRVPSTEQNSEISLARAAIIDRTPGFADRLREQLICDLLGRLSAEKRRRAARNLNHWDEYAPVRVQQIAGRLLAARGRRIAAYLDANRERLWGLAFRVTQDERLADEALAQTSLELWQGHTQEEVCARALKMNARDLLKIRSRGAESLDGMISAGLARGEELDFPSHRLEDRDPLEILLAREKDRERNDELEYAIRNVRRPKNWWMTQLAWWKNSGLAEYERHRKTRKFGGSVE